MRGTFGAQITKLREQVGHGTIEGKVTVNQIYAHYQHEHPEFHHPRGGGAFYLRDPLFEHGPNAFMRTIAEKALHPDGPADAMKDNMERLSWEVFLRAPWEFGDLKASGNPSVRVNGRKVYDRLPNVRRLSKGDLRIKSHLRSLYKGILS